MEQPVRYHGLDGLRAGAMILGIVLHAGLVYTEPSIVENTLAYSTEIKASPWVEALSGWIHLWRMPLFFILAGFFAQMVLERRGAGAFVKDRAIRILTTCVIFTLLFNALFDMFWGELQHLWFLWVLWWFCALAALLHRLRIARHIRAFAWFFARPSRLWGFWALAVLGAQTCRDQTFFQVFPIHFLDPAPQGYAYFGAFFLAGQGLWQGREILGALAQRRRYSRMLAIGLTATLAYLALFDIMRAEVEVTAPLIGLAFYLIAGALSAAATVAMSFGLIGMTQALITRSSRGLTWLIRLSYPVYVFHLNIVVILGVMLVVRAPEFPQLAAILITSTATFAISSLIYLALVRYTPLEWLFAGWKNAWITRRVGRLRRRKA